MCIRDSYRHAGALVFPSRYEGFGLPVVEAQALGCPVVAARSSSLPEVAGQGALFVDPDRPQDVPSMVRELIADPARRAEMVAAGSVNAAPVSYTHLDVYKRQRRCGQAGTSAGRRESCGRACRCC